MILVRIVLICSLRVIKACSVGNVLAYGALWWLFLILMQVFQPMCFLSYNTWINIKNKFSVWPSRVYGSIETIRFGTILLKHLKIFVLVQVLFLLVGGMLRLFVIIFPNLQLLWMIWSGLNQVPTSLNVMSMRPFLKLEIGSALVCVFEMMKVVMC